MIKIATNYKRLLADVFTPVAIYLRLRDQFRDTVLLESSDFNGSKNSFSFIGIHAIAGIEFTDFEKMEFKLPGAEIKKIFHSKPPVLSHLMEDFMNKFEFSVPEEKIILKAQQLFGYTSYDAVGFKEDIIGRNRGERKNIIPLIRYRLYQYVIIINHFTNELLLCENKAEGLESRIDEIEGMIKRRDIPAFPFSSEGEVSSNLTDDEYRKLVSKGIGHCAIGDVFQMVISRSFKIKYSGDDFNVYRTLRSINPSPYLFYFDYGDYRLFGSSPESQVVAVGTEAIIHPIAGTFRRTGNDDEDKKLAQELQQDPKENAEHVMLVDLSRNDLNMVCEDVSVAKFKEVQFFSHVIHLVSEVKGRIEGKANPFSILMATFPAGTLTGAPKVKAMELIERYEPTARSYYGGCIGAIGFDGSVNHAILIRSFLSRNHHLYYQAGAGVTIASNADKELQEVNNKLSALNAAIEAAQNI